MRRGLERAGELPQEMSPHLEGHQWSLFFRLARKRADYFSDIEDLLPMPEADVGPTRRVSVRKCALTPLLTPREGFCPLVDQPTRLNLITEAPTLLLPAVSALSARGEATPVTLKLLATTSAGQDPAPVKERISWRPWKGALEWRPRLRSARPFWSDARRPRGGSLDQLSSSSRSTGE